jgi:Na+-driven multidrug efflux pump
VEIIQSILVYVSILLLFDQYALIAMGILKAIRKENTALFIYVFWYYVYAIPGSILIINYSALQLKGIWIIWGSSLIAIATLQLICIVCTDLNKQFMRQSGTESLEVVNDIEESIFTAEK